MAEAVVTSLLEMITTALIPEMLNQAFSSMAQVKEARRRIERIKSEFAVMQAFLKHTDAGRDQNEPFRVWLEDLRNAAHHMEDIIDEYAYLNGKRSRIQFSSSICKTLSAAKDATAWRHINTQLQDMEVKLHDLTDAKKRYGIKTRDGGTISTEMSERHRHFAQAAHFIDEDALVGIEKNREVLTGWLTDEDQRRVVVSVWGMGGLGKTTLVTNVYKRLIGVLFNYYAACAWVSVSQNCTTNDLLRRIIRELYEENKDLVPHSIDILDYRRLVQTIREYLQQKRYLIVLDDVWNRDVWNDINVALLDCNCGSRIVITTRARDVSSLATENRSLELQPLKEKEAWTLLCRNAFRIGISRPRELQYWAQKIVERCEGLPLAIVAIGRLLSLKEKNELAWKQVHDNLGWEMTERGELRSMVFDILNLSFNDLPSQLRNCFLYFGSFPEGYLVKRTRLIRLWVAEGFVKERGSYTMEEVAEECLNELIHRCLLQVVERNNFGRVKACRMHDLVRELIVLRSRNEKYAMVYDDNSEDKMGDGARHLSVHKRNRIFQLGNGMKNLRSFFVFDAPIFSSSGQLHSVISSFRLLRILDLRRIPIERVPNQVFHLFNLHYLGLRQTNIKDIPSSLGRLQNLQTLDLWGTNVMKAPCGIRKLKNLRHLLAGIIPDPTSTVYNPFRGMHAPRGICDLKDLQTLLRVRASKEIVKHAGTLTHMRCFGITEVRGTHGEDLCASITMMKRLLSLSVAARDEGEELCMRNLSPPPSHLQKLLLQGKLEKGMLPPWFCSSDNLMHLELYWSGLTEDPLPSLSTLPNLIDLRLIKAYEGQKLSFSAGWFPKLKKLFFCNLTQFNCMEIETGALESLHELLLLKCGELKVVPHGLENLGALQNLELVEMPTVLVESLYQQQDNMKNCFQIRHIPKITNWIQAEGRWELFP